LVSTKTAALIEFLPRNLGFHAETLHAPEQLGHVGTRGGQLPLVAHSSTALEELDHLLADRGPALRGTALGALVNVVGNLDVSVFMFAGPPDSVLWLYQLSRATRPSQHGSNGRAANANGGPSPRLYDRLWGGKVHPESPFATASAS
jgi:hypothetical protein